MTARIQTGHWQKVSLGEHCEVQTGFPFPSELFDETKGTPLIRVRSLKAQSCDIRINGIIDDAFIVGNGSVLIGMDGDFQPCLWRGGNALLNQRVCRLKDFSPELNPYFAYLALKEPLRQLEERTHFTTVKHLSSTSIKEIEIPLPPISEQRAIANLLNNIQEARDASRQELTLERERKAALMEHLFTHGTRGEATKQAEIGKLPESWRVAPLSEVTKISSGGTPDRSKTEYWGGTIPWVKTGEIRYNTIVSAEEGITQEGLDNSAAKIVPAGTLLMAMYGQGVTRGKVAILGIDAAINQACAAITPRNTDLLPKFAFHYLQFAYERIRVLGHGANQKNLNSHLVGSIPVPLPPLAEQEEISHTLTAIDSKVASIEDERRLLSELFYTLLEELMMGKVSVAGLIDGGSNA